MYRTVLVGLWGRSPWGLFCPHTQTSQKFFPHMDVWNGKKFWCLWWKKLLYPVFLSLFFYYFFLNHSTSLLYNHPKRVSLNPLWSVHHFLFMLLNKSNMTHFHISFSFFWNLRELAYARNNWVSQYIYRQLLHWKERVYLNSFKPFSLACLLCAYSCFQAEIHLFAKLRQSRGFLCCWIMAPQESSGTS